MGSEDNMDALVFQRRVTDIQQEKIDALIAEEPDSKIRLMLMVMSNINKSIVANTDLTHAIHKEVRALKTELDTHVETMSAINNQRKGAARVLKVAGPILWTVMAAVIGVMYQHYDQFHEETRAAFTAIDVKLEHISTKIVLYHGPDPLLDSDATAAAAATPPVIKKN